MAGPVPASVVPICTVRACGEALRLDAGALVCGRGHSFNIARSGYINLLQPQDKKSKNPGDSKEAVDARRRLLDGGLGAPLLTALVEVVGETPPAAGTAALDVGAGDGTFLDAIAKRFSLEGWGVDLSTPAMELAAKRHRDRHWLVANADRHLPFADGVFALVLSITARRNAPEFRRVLAPGGRLVVVIPAEDDLAELREAVLGEAVNRDRREKLFADFAESFELVHERDVRHVRHYAAAGLADLLATTYRGARHRAQERLAKLDALDVTSSYRIAAFTPKGR